MQHFPAAGVARGLPCRAAVLLVAAPRHQWLAAAQGWLAGWPQAMDSGQLAAPAALCVLWGVKARAVCTEHSVASAGGAHAPPPSSNTTLEHHHTLTRKSTTPTYAAFARPSPPGLRSTRRTCARGCSRTTPWGSGTTGARAAGPLRARAACVRARVRACVLSLLAGWLARGGAARRATLQNVVRTAPLPFRRNHNPQLTTWARAPRPAAPPRACAGRCRRWASPRGRGW